MVANRKIPLQQNQRGLRMRCRQVASLDSQVLTLSRARWSFAKNWDSISGLQYLFRYQSSRAICKISNTRLPSDATTSTISRRLAVVLPLPSRSESLDPDGLDIYKLPEAVPAQLPAVAATLHPA